jgi:hypothetical protein
LQESAVACGLTCGKHPPDAPVRRPRGRPGLERDDAASLRIPTSCAMSSQTLRASIALFAARLTSHYSRQSAVSIY